MKLLDIDQTLFAAQTRKKKSISSKRPSNSLLFLLVTMRLYDPNGAC
jgi:hypothetical protein